MKIVYPEFEHQIIMKENVIQLIVIEKPEIFYTYVNDLFTQCSEGQEGKCILSEADEILNLEKKAFIITNPFELDINNKKILNNLYSQLKQRVYESEYYLDTNQFLSELSLYLEKISEQAEYDLEYDLDIDISAIFKLAGVRLLKSYDSFLEEIVDYIGIMQQLLNMNIGIFVNIRSCLSEDNLEKLYAMAAYKKLYLILIESHLPEQRLEKEEVYIIDKDGCEIY